MLTVRGGPSLYEHIHKLGPTERNGTGRQLMQKNLMIGTAFQDIAHLLTMMEETSNSWHLILIRGRSKTSKLFPFTGADFSTLEAWLMNTIFQIFKTHLTGGLDKTLQLN
jgi:hypothetical protein